MEDPSKIEQIYEQIKLLLYPENLETSKVCQIINEEMTFKLEDFFTLREVQKFLNSKESLNDILERIQNEDKIIKINDNTNDITILLDENYTAFNFINVPNKMKKAELSQILEIGQDDSIPRLYKHSLFWILISNNLDFTQNLEKKLKSIKFDGESVKFDVTPYKILKRNINKQIQHNVYMKETDELKASSSNARKDSNNFKQNDRKHSNTQSTGNTDALSWRKKSDVSNSSATKEETHVNNVNNYPKKISIFNSSSNTLFNKRERFNSDPHDKRKVPQDNQSDFNQAFHPPQEIWIDPKLVNYSLTINRKYTPRDMLDFYEKIQEKLSNAPTEFKPFVEEVCNLQAKALNFSRFSSNSRKNSDNLTNNNTYNNNNLKGINSGFEFRTSLKSFDKNDKMFLPKNNPLQELENMNLNK